MASRRAEPASGRHPQCRRGIAIEQQQRGFWKDGIEMAISRDQVLHVAKLARLDLREEEVERLTEELGAILDAVSKVAELDLADVPPTSHPLELVNAWADDEPHASLPLDDVFANAPAREGDLFRVPPTA
jgi:aspartyl-tRNA(Asn)/glutamyl-tRNA(Gln) amidotransferase subunit C